MISEKNIPQCVYWRNQSAAAKSLSDSLCAEKWDAKFNVVDTPEQFAKTLEHPQLQVIVSHDLSMTDDIVNKVQSSCPDAILVIMCADETKLSEKLRECAIHVVNERQLDQLSPLLRRALRRSKRTWSLKNDRKTASERARILDVIGEAVIVQEPNGTITTWNAAASKLFGWTEQEALGRQPCDVLTIKNAPNEKEIAAALTKNGSWSGTLCYHGKNKLEAYVHSRVTWLDGEPSKGRIEICTDLTAERLESWKTCLVTRAQLLFATALPLKEQLEQFSKLIVPTCADICTIDLLGDDGGIRRMAFATRYPALQPWPAEAWEEFPIFPSNRPTALDAMRQSKPQIVAPVDDLSAYLGITDEGLGKELRKIHATSALTAAISSEGEPIGVVTLISSASSPTFSESDIQRLAQFSLTIAAASELSRRKQNVGRMRRPQSDAELYYKDAFLGAVSHELRTPLQAMFGWTQLMRDKKLTAVETENALEALELSLNAQNKIVNDLLDLSRINSGRLELTPKPVELRPLLEKSLEAFQVPAAIKQIELLFSPPTGPIWVMADATWLQSSLWRILSNSIKFTPMNGTVNVTLSCEDEYAVVTISDNGVGIDPRFLPHIFEHFSQFDMSTTRSHSGLGIGLAIARHIVEAHGGSIEVSSDGLNKGSTFRVILPRSGAADLPQDTHDDALHGNSSQAALSGVRVLVVEDEFDTRNLLCFVLNGAGAIVREAASAKDGLDALNASQFDVLICDLGMPKEDGFSLIRKVRALPPERGGRIPALALTAYASKEDRVKALRAGFQMHASKPVDISELILLLRALLTNTIPMQ